MKDGFHSGAEATPGAVVNFLVCCLTKHTQQNIDAGTIDPDSAAKWIADRRNEWNSTGTRNMMRSILVDLDDSFWGNA